MMMPDTMIERIAGIIATALGEERENGMFSEWTPEKTARADLCDDHGRP